jgi:hypothetical protein
MMFVLFAFAALNLPEDKAVQPELAKLQGTWSFQTLEINGQQFQAKH